MEFLWIGLGVLGGLALLVLAASFVCYRLAFYAPPRKPTPEGVIPVPEGPVYEPYRDLMTDWGKTVRQLPCRRFTMTSRDGLVLQGYYYEQTPGATIELMLHGYRGSTERDMGGAVIRSFAMGHNAFLVDQRCAGKSQGRTITFGIKEKWDCLDWLERIRAEFGPDQPVILTGISMGAATVMLAAGEKLPENVRGVLADCGYSSIRQIIQKVIRQLKLPAKLFYPLVRLGALLFGHFDPEADSPIAAMARCKVPVIFFHGQKDDFVPWEMSKACFEACGSEKKQLVLMENAGHGLAYPAEPERYLKALRDFFY